MILTEKYAEKLIGKCESWQDFRKYEDELREPWSKAIEPIRNTIEGRFEQLEYTGSKVRVSSSSFLSLLKSYFESPNLTKV